MTGNTELRRHHLPDDVQAALAQYPRAKAHLDAAEDALHAGKPQRAGFLAQWCINALDWAGIDTEDARRWRARAQEIAALELVLVEVR